MSAFLKRVEILETLRGPGPGHRLVEWLTDVIVRGGWSVQIIPRDSRIYSGFALAEEGVIQVYGPVEADADTSVAVVLHEAGHCADPHRGDRVARPVVEIGDGERRHRVISVEGEAFAWLWAQKKAGHRWTPPMQAELEACLRSYGGHVTTIGDLEVFRAALAYTREVAEERRVVRLKPRTIPVPDVLKPLVLDMGGAA